MENHVQDQVYNLIDKPAIPSIAQLMEDGNLLNFGQTGVIVVNHAMEDLDGEHEKGAVPTQAQSMAEKNVLDLIQKQLLKNATYLLVLIFVLVTDQDTHITTHQMVLS